MDVQSSILLTAVSQENHLGTVCVYSSADGNIMCARTVDAIIASGVDVNVSALPPTVFLTWLPQTKPEFVRN